MQNATDESQNPEQSSPHQPKFPSEADVILLNSSDVHEIPEPIVSNDPRTIPAPPSKADIPAGNAEMLLTILGGLLALGFGTYIAWLLLRTEPDFDAMPSNFSEEAEEQGRAP